MDEEWNCILYGHEWSEEIHCEGCGGYLGTFCDICGAEVSSGYNVGTCTCHDPEWAEAALASEDDDG